MQYRRAAARGRQWLQGGGLGPRGLAALPQSAMEPRPDHDPSARGLHTKRLKELENAALQSTLASRTEAGPGADAGESERGDGDVCGGGGGGGDPAKERLREERTLTDHLNKRLLSSFLEKLNQRDLALPGVQRLDCAVADEDSNRAADEW